MFFPRHDPRPGVSARTLLAFALGAAAVMVAPRFLAGLIAVMETALTP